LFIEPECRLSHLWASDEGSRWQFYRVKSARLTCGLWLFAAKTAQTENGSAATAELFPADRPIFPRDISLSRFRVADHPTVGPRKQYGKALPALGKGYS